MMPMRSALELMAKPETEEAVLGLHLALRWPRRAAVRWGLA